MSFAVLVRRNVSHLTVCFIKIGNDSPSSVNINNIQLTPPKVIDLSYDFLLENRMLMYCIPKIGELRPMRLSPMSNATTENGKQMKTIQIIQIDIKVVKMRAE